MEVTCTKGSRLEMKDFVSILEWVYCGVNICECMDFFSLSFVPPFVQFTPSASRGDYEVTLYISPICTLV